MSQIYENSVGSTSNQSLYGYGQGQAESMFDYVNIITRTWNKIINAYWKTHY